MAADRSAVFAIPVAAALLLWPALWNGYPIVFADTGTYLSQAIHHYAGWDRPVFYSMFMFPLHLTITLWPVVVAQALLAAWVLWLTCRTLLPKLSAPTFIAGIAALSAYTWLPWIVSELMPDLFTPLLVLLLCLLAWTPERLSPRKQAVLVGLATFMIATQQSSLPLACVLLAVLGGRRLSKAMWRLVPAAQPGSNTVSPSGLHTMLWPGLNTVSPQGLNTVSWPGLNAVSPQGSTPVSWPGLARPPTTSMQSTQQHPKTAHPRRAATPTISPRRRCLLISLPPVLAILALCTVNLAAHARFAISPFGNIFLLARVIYDGPGMAILQRDCPVTNWRLCRYRNSFPATSDDFLWTSDSPLYQAGGPKLVSQNADQIIKAALMAEPARELHAALTNTLAQLIHFDSGDGLNPWPNQVSPAIEHDFPAREHAAYAAASQQTGQLSVPPVLEHLHIATAIAGVIACMTLLPLAIKQRAAATGFLLGVLLVIPLSAAITGSLSTPHDRYQSRIMWLPPFIAMVSALSLMARPPITTNQAV